MRTVWKFQLETTDTQTIHAPEGAEFLAVHTQRGIPCLWAIVNAERSLQERVIETFGTGHLMHVDMGVERKYLGSYQMHGETLVFHVFERTS